MKLKARSNRARLRRLKEDPGPIEYALVLGALVGAALAALPLIILFALPSNKFSAEAWNEAPVVAVGPILLGTASVLCLGCNDQTGGGDGSAVDSRRRSQEPLRR